MAEGSDMSIFTNPMIDGCGFITFLAVRENVKEIKRRCYSPFSITSQLHCMHDPLFFDNQMETKPDNETRSLYYSKNVQVSSAMLLVNSVHYFN